MKHYHWASALSFLRNYILLACLPLLYALIEWEFSAVIRALVQNAFLFLVLSGYGYFSWRASGWNIQAVDNIENTTEISTNSTLLRLKHGIFIRQEETVAADVIAAITLENTLFLHVLHATRVSIYCAAPAQRAKITLLLPRADATALSNALLPAPAHTPQRPSYTGQLCLSLLSTNIFATVALFYVASQQTAVLGTWIQTLAYVPVQNAVNVAAAFFPRAIAFVLGVFGFWLCVSVLRSFLHTSGYRFQRSGTVLCASYGIFQRTSCRIRTQHILYYELQKTPLARLLRFTPIYITAGSYHAHGVPFYLCRTRDLHTLDSLLPRFHCPPETRDPITGRTLLPFFAPSGTVLLASIVALVLSYQHFPVLLPICVSIVLFALGFVLVALEGFFREGAYRTAHGRTLCYFRFLTIHTICYIASRPPTSVFQNPFSVFTKRGNLTIRPCKGQKIKIHSVLLKSLGDF